jgi:hypothetical protein
MGCEAFCKPAVDVEAESYRAGTVARVSKRSATGIEPTTPFDNTLTLPAAPGPWISPWVTRSPTRYQTSVPTSLSRTFSAKAFGGATGACVFTAFFVLEEARFVAAFFGFVMGAEIFFRGFVGGLFLVFFGFLDAAVRELGFFRLFAFFLVAMIALSPPGSLAERCMSHKGGRR